MRGFANDKGQFWITILDPKEPASFCRRDITINGLEPRQEIELKIHHGDVVPRRTGRYNA